jgi:hypothetical protein
VLGRVGVGGLVISILGNDGAVGESEMAELGVGGEVERVRTGVLKSIHGLGRRSIHVGDPLLWRLWVRERSGGGPAAKEGHS